MTDPAQGGEHPPGPAWLPSVPPPGDQRHVPVYRPQPYGHPGSYPGGSGPDPFGSAEEFGPPGYAPPPYGQPPYVYGRPSYAPPQLPPGYGAPPARRRTGLIWALAAVVVVAVATAVVLSLVLRTRVLDRSAVQRDVATQFQRLEGVAIQLRCAGSMPLTTGAVYRCQGTTTAGEQVTLQIQVTDAQRASYTWSEQR